MKINILNIELLSYEVHTDVDYIDIINCPACGATQNQKLLTSVETEDKIGLTVSFCQNCGHGYHSRLPSVAWFDAYYLCNWDTGINRYRPLRTRVIEAAMKTSFLRGVVSLAKHINYRIVQHPNQIKISMLRGLAPWASDLDCLPRGAKLLEIGCGYGHSLGVFRQAGFDVFGTEANQIRVDACRAQGLKVELVDSQGIGAMAKHGPYDFIYSCHVFEHLADLEGVMQNCRNLVAPDGYIYIEVPNANVAENLFHRAHVPTHCHMFSASSLTALLKRFGFTPVRCLLDINLHIVAFRGESDLHFPNVNARLEPDTMVYNVVPDEIEGNVIEIRYDHFHLSMGRQSEDSPFLERRSPYAVKRQGAGKTPYDLIHSITIQAERSNETLWPMRFVHSTPHPPMFVKKG